MNSFIPKYPKGNSKSPITNIPIGTIEIIPQRCRFLSIVSYIVISLIRIMCSRSIFKSLYCWFAPNISLKLRQMLVQTEAEDDFLQLQTLVAILMNTDIDTLDALWQMCQHSRIHKDMLLYCYHIWSIICKSVNPGMYPRIISMKSSSDHSDSLLK